MMPHFPGQDAVEHRRLTASLESASLSLMESHGRVPVMSESLIVPELEWEPLSVEGPRHFDLPEGNPIGQGLDTLELSRDPDWRLKVVASSESYQAKPPDRLAELPAGQAMPTIADVVATQSRASLVLPHASLGAWSTTSMPDGTRQKVRTSHLRIILNDRETATSVAQTCSIWCLNGPERDFPYSMGTSRKRVVRYERSRHGFPDHVHTHTRNKGDTRDAVMLPPPVCGTAPAVLATVPNGLPIDYALRPVAIEFLLTASGKAPVWEEIEPYLAAVSFVIGRRLIPVGFTLFNNKSWPSLHELCSAWSIDLGAECKRSGAPPVHISHNALSCLIPRFVDRVVELKLIDAMWLVWLAQSVPLEVSLPILASALECMKIAWFKSTKTKSGGRYMPAADWDSVSGEAIKVLHDALEGRPYADRIERKVQGVNNRSGNESFEHFFEELELPFGEVELSAIRARNKAAHGGSFSPSEGDALYDTASAYRSLVYRVMLALLEWEGDYVDYSTYGFPSRQLKEKLGGPAGDGKAARL
jgi:hypothetical protein